ncbi:MAG: RsmD family RNA methyltransferase [Alphaproteobacteria bacterium]|nr:MAG: hypothetical protein B6I23_03410 [Rickettsiaceae bacterium 4572_127]
MFKIISGKFRGKKIVLPAESIVRPTSNRAREALFSIIDSNFDSSFETMIEPFAGSGIMSFEAISRRVVERAILFEKDKATAKLLEKNSQSFSEKLNVEIKNKSVFEEDFDEVENAIFFIDPPYNKSHLLVDFLKKIENVKNCLVICESEKEIPPLSNPLISKKYGRANFYFYKK